MSNSSIVRAAVSDKSQPCILPFPANRISPPRLNLRGLRDGETDERRLDFLKDLFLATDGRDWAAIVRESKSGGLL